MKTNPEVSHITSCKEKNIYYAKTGVLHQSTSASTCGAIPNPVWVGSKWLLAFPRVPVTPGTLLAQTIFLPCCPLNDRRRAARSFFKIGRLSSPFSFHYLARPGLLILLPLLISGNVRPNPGSIFSCSGSAGNVAWRGRSVQCCTCSKWVHLRCSLLSTKFRILDSSHSWSCP